MRVRVRVTLGRGHEGLLVQVELARDHGVRAASGERDDHAVRAHARALVEHLVAARRSEGELRSGTGLDG